MSLPRTYESILADILEKRRNNCVCPEEYLTPPKPLSKPTTPCQFGPNCQFEMHSVPAKTCAYDATVCTCVQCTCGVDFPSPPGVQESGVQKPEVQKCEKSVCDCFYCTCQPEVSSPNLFPTSFRKLLKTEGRKMMTDEEMREERQAIKQLIEEVREEPKETDVEVKKVKRNRSKSDVEDSMVKEEPKQAKQEDSPKQSLKSSKTVKVSIAVPTESTQDNKSTKKMSGRFSKASSSAKKSRKTKSQKIIMPTPKVTKTVQYWSRMKITENKKPLRIRYYYSGDVENYGVKLGHDKCLEKVVSVPKTMGWLWNIEDPSKGIRERKGWPPGFIGKNIKNMIQVMKKFASGDPAADGEAGADSKGMTRWKTQPDMRVALDEPKEEPPLLHIHKKGRRYDITFCPKGSDEDIGPVPIPFSITQKKRDGDSETDDSSLEFEFHSPKPRPRWNQPEPQKMASVIEEKVEAKAPPPPPTPGPKPPKGKKKNRKSMVSVENKNNWEDHPTQIENVPSSTVAGS